jgi:hypothetical protein
MSGDGLGSLLKKATATRSLQKRHRWKHNELRNVVGLGCWAESQGPPGMNETLADGETNHSTMRCVTRR